MHSFQTNLYLKMSEEQLNLLSLFLATLNSKSKLQTSLDPSQHQFLTHGASYYFQPPTNPIQQKETPLSPGEPSSPSHLYLL